MHRRWCASTPGGLSRSERWWDFLFADHEDQRRGGTALFHLVHDGGYVSYRMDHADRTCRIIDHFVVTDEARVALWRVLLAMDLGTTISSHSGPVDDPLPMLLTDPRAVRTTGLTDGLWARVLDVPAALAARRYAAELDVVLDVRDTFLGRGGRFRLRGGPDGATCEPTTATTGVGVEVAALGAMLLGGHRAGTLARAGLLTSTDPDELRRVDTAFGGDHAPQFGTDF